MAWAWLRSCATSRWVRRGVCRQKKQAETAATELPDQQAELGLDGVFMMQTEANPFKESEEFADVDFEDGVDVVMMQMGATALEESEEFYDTLVGGVRADFDFDDGVGAKMC